MSGTRVGGQRRGRTEQLGAIAAEGRDLIASDYVAVGMHYERDVLAPIEGGALETTTLVGSYLFRAAPEV